MSFYKPKTNLTSPDIFRIHDCDPIKHLSRLLIHEYFLLDQSLDKDLDEYHAFVEWLFDERQIEDILVKF